jgi:hypothetical protein
MKKLLLVAAAIAAGSLSASSYAAEIAPMGGTVDLRSQWRDLHDRIIGDDSLSLSREPPPARADVETDRIRLFTTMQLRSAGSSSRIVGDGLPVDAQMGALCGSILAWRVGAQLGRVGAYGVFGGGTWTVYRHILPTADGRPINVDTARAGYGFIGIGTEVQLHKGLVAAAEVDMGRVVVSTADDVVLAPSPDQTVKSAFAGLRFNY